MRITINSLALTHCILVDTPNQLNLNLKQLHLWSESNHIQLNFLHALRCSGTKDNACKSVVR